MNIEELRDFCLSLPLSDETFPFDPTTLVYKTNGKMYLMVDLNDPTVVAVKCNPDRAVELRERFEQITPAWHMNKRHWIDVRIDSDLADDLVRSLIADSHSLVRAKSKPRRAQSVGR